MLEEAIPALLCSGTPACSTILPVKALTSDCMLLPVCDALRLLESGTGGVAKATVFVLRGLEKNPRFNPLDGLAALVSRTGCSAAGSAVLADPLDILLSGGGTNAAAAGFPEPPAGALVGSALAVAVTAASPARKKNPAWRIAQ